MRSILLFTAGMVAGGFLMQTGSAQQTADRVALNHIAIAVKNYDEALDFYKNAMGFKEAFNFKEPDGSPYLTYLQISRDTFLEIQPATAQRPAGVSHLGLEVSDIKAYVSRLKQRGVQVAGPALSQRSGSLLASGTGGGGLRFELLQFLPGSSQRKAIEKWK